MTITSTVTTYEATGNGTATSYIFNYPIHKARDLLVYAAGSVRATGDSTYGHTVTVAADKNSATVVFTTAPADTIALKFVRELEYKQETDLANNSLFDAESLETTLDNIVMQLQQVGNVVTSTADARTFSFDGGIATSDYNTDPATASTLNSNKAARLGKTLIFNSTTGDLDISDLNIDAITTSVTAAGVSASGASSSATAAGNSATAASNSATASAASEAAANASADAVAVIYDVFHNNFLGSMADGATQGTNPNPSGTWAKNSSTITVSSKTNIKVGQVVTGTGIPTSPKPNVISIHPSADTIVISDNMDAAGSGVTLTCTGYGVYGTFNSPKDGPALNNDGDALTDGLLYFNTSDDLMKVYDVTSTSWKAIQATDITTSSFTTGALVIESEGIGSNDNDTTIPTSAAVKDFVDSAVSSANSIDELTDTDISSPADASLLLYDTATSTWRDGALSGDAAISDTGAITVNSSAISYAKIQNISNTNRILGRDSSGAGVIEEITPANLLTMIGVESGADVTDTTNVTAAGALMDSELAGIAAIKATTGTFLTADQTKLDGIEASADVTDATNVTAAGALMDSECTSLSSVKALTGTNTGDQSASAIKTLLEDGIDSVHYVDGSIDTDHIGNLQVTAAKVAADVATQAELDAVSVVANAGASTGKAIAMAIVFGG